MLTTKLAIKNAAAAKLGEPPMADGDTTTLATTLDAHYERVRKLTLRKSLWKFAMVRETIYSHANTDKGSGFSKVAPVCDDLLRLLEVWSGNCILAPSEYSYEGRHIFSDCSSLSIKFITDFKDYREMPDDFANAFACLLAAECNPIISGGRRSTESLMQDYQLALMDARKANMLESPNVNVDDPYDDIIRSRINGPVY